MIHTSQQIDTMHCENALHRVVQVFTINIHCSVIPHVLTKNKHHYHKFRIFVQIINPSIVFDERSSDGNKHGQCIYIAVCYFVQSQIVCNAFFCNITDFAYFHIASPLIIYLLPSQVLQASECLQPLHPTQRKL